MTSSVTKFDTGHEDLIHDISYDFYGKRLVTCSTDQRLKVWDFVERPNASVWELNDVWKAHDASILKATWARPEYGQVIASCSFDRQVKIWEEQTIEPRNSQKRWAERFRLVESRGAVLDIAFAPTPNLLRLATCSSDGIIRIYEALEPTNLAQWSQMEEFEISSSSYTNHDAKKNYPSSHPPQQPQQPLYTSQQLQNQQSMLQQQLLQQKLQQQQQQYPSTPHGLNRQTGSTLTSPQHQQFQTHITSANQYPQQHPFSQQQQQPVNTTSTSSSNSSVASYGISTPGVSDIPTMTSTTTAVATAATATATTTGAGATATTAFVHGVSPASSSTNVQTGNNIHRPIDADSGYCIDWCPNRTPTAMMVVGLGKEVGARIFKHDGNSRWLPGEFLPGHTQEVHDVSWAPSMARSYQLIATASKDHCVRIYKLTEQTLQQQQQQQQKQQERPSHFSPSDTPTQSNQALKLFHVELIACFDDHQAEVWRVEWNVTGTILTSSGDDGKLRMWTVGYDGKWRQMACIIANTQVP